MEDQKLESYVIPGNFRVPGKWRRFYIRNLAEAGIAVLVTGSVITGSRLIWQAKFIAACLVCGSAAALFINGINGMSVSEFGLRYARFVFRKYIRYHFRRPELIYGEIGKDSKEREERKSGKRPWERLVERFGKKPGKA